METKFKILKIDEITEKYISKYKVTFIVFTYVKILLFKITLYKKKYSLIFTFLNYDKLPFVKNKSFKFIQLDKKFETELDQFLLHCKKTLIKRRIGL